MLARSGRLPTGGDFAYEVKWDGFRAIVSTEGPLRVRSRRGWDMTEHVGFLAELPVRAVLDGELVALDAARPLHSTPKLLSARAFSVCDAAAARPGLRCCRRDE